MAVIVADTDVLIDALRGRDPAKSRIAIELRAGSLATTVVNAFELLSGARESRERTKVETLLGALSFLSLDQAAARTAASLRRELESRGAGIGMADYLIAAICLERNAILLTRNRSHFERVPDLVLGTL
jgi:tRNA(fMet)-specific endonuclease VapC